MDYKKAEESTVHYMEAGAAAGGNGRTTRAPGTDGRKGAAILRCAGVAPGKSRGPVSRRTRYAAKGYGRDPMG
jgi:hypothetical protein